jgi:uncharacterized RDD family membrane protein YckC
MASTIKLVAGIIIILIGFPVFIGGSAILLVTPAFADNDGYFVSQSFHLEQSGVAAIRLDIPLEKVHMGMQIDPSDFVTLKVNINQGTNPNAEAFLGLTTEARADLLLESISYVQIYNLNFYSGIGIDSDVSEPEISWNTHPNTTSWAVPSVGGVSWLVGGYNDTTFIWEPSYADVTTGSLSLILMNSDVGAANNVDLTFSIGARVPIINAIGWVLTVFGGLMTLLGVIVVWSGLRSKPSHARRTRYYQGAPVTRVVPIERIPSQFQLQCSNCGAINEQDSSFCSQCGEILLKEDRTTVQAAVKETKLDTFEPTSNKLVVAEWGPRFWAFVIDWFIISAITSSLSSLLFLSLGNWSFWSFGLFSPFQWFFSLGPSSLVFFVYSIAMETYYGQTLGKMALNLEVISEHTGERPILQELAISSVGKAFFLPIDLIVGRIIREEHRAPDLNQRLTQKWSNVVVIQKTHKREKTTQFVSNRL